MGYRVLCLIGAILTALTLAGCDNCGKFEKFNLPSIPKSCHAVPTPG